MPVAKKTLNAVAAVAQAAPGQAFHSPGLSPGASAGNLNLKTRSKGSNAMVEPVRRRLRTKTPPVPAQRVPSMGLGALKGPLPRLNPSLELQQAQEEDQVQRTWEEEEEIHLLAMVISSISW